MPLGPSARAYNSVNVLPLIKVQLASGRRKFLGGRHNFYNIRFGSLQLRSGFLPLVPEMGPNLLLSTCPLANGSMLTIQARTE
ncbi:hypothetical protein O181_018956 [Austropuccinia psidii MF-1]|uniref:Uncharacterized protein n=1 Tax=Austropuccinia psidii MF-1 TaxID=1389203 RepID=A0A9Q3CAK2_9BASI|nr:hypothetical protein [Austropuccinia psidii MF-1]